MRLIVNDTCYTHLMWMLTFRSREFSKAVYKYECSSPRFDFEGIAGYIECELSFEIQDLALFSKIFFEWYTTENRSEFYDQIVREQC